MSERCRPCRHRGDPKSCFSEPCYLRDDAWICQHLKGEIAQLRSRCERQRDRIRYLEDATNHAGGTPLSKAHDELAELRADFDKWRLVAGKMFAEKDSEIARLRNALEQLFPSVEGFCEAMDALVDLGILVPVKSDERFRAEWGDEVNVMHVWAWHACRYEGVVTDE